MANQRPYKPAGMPALMPYLYVVNAEETIRFWKEAFGFELCFEPMRQDGKIVHAEVALGEARVMFAPEEACVNTAARSPKTSGVAQAVGLYIYVPDVDALYARAVNAGAQSKQAPETQFYGDRNCRLTDPNGYEWSFATNVADFDPSLAPH